MEPVENISSSLLKEINFKISNMICEGCAEKITSILTALPGVLRVKPKIMQKKVIVRYQGDKVSRDKLSQALANAGYHTTEIL